MIIRMMAVASAAALLAGAAHAQAASSPSQTGSPVVSDTAGQAPVDGADAQTSTAGPAPVTDTTGYNSRAGASAAPSADAAPQPAATETTVVSNGPVPDTAANRAKYGSPDSSTGKRTRPAGN